MRIVTARQAASLVHDRDTLLIGGSGGGHAVPEALIVALEQHYLETGRPRGLTALHPVGIGDEVDQGVNRLAHEGLIRRVVCGTLVDSPRLAKLALDNRIEAYTLPQGALSQLMREMAAGRPGLVTKVGLHTFVDPRVAGGRQSESATEDLVEVVHLLGEEWLLYRPYRVDVAFLRGTTVDEDGNVTMEREAVFAEMLSMAQATRRNGGVVVVQAERVARRGTLPPKQVKIPGILVDVVVVDPDPRQTYDTKYSPAYAGELRVPIAALPSLPLNGAKVILRRAALELVPEAVCNLGSGVMTGLSAVAAEEGILDRITLTNEQGLIGGAPASGNDAGAATNYSAMIDQPYQFDFYDGGGLDIAFLSFAEVDAEGNVNISRFADRIIGVGGFINISQNARKVVFGGTFTAGGLAVECDGTLRILREGRHRKFVPQLTQRSYSGQYARLRGQEVMYVTERAVFVLAEGRLKLVEIAPGMDLQQDVLAQMTFRPEIAEPLREMDARLFGPAPLGLDKLLEALPAKEKAERLAGLAIEEVRRATEG